MRKTFILIISVLMAGSLFAAGCKKAKETEPPKKDNTQTIPTEPAPVPPGTPKY